MTSKYKDEVDKEYFRCSQDLHITPDNYNVLLLGSCVFDAMIGPFQSRCKSVHMCANHTDIDHAIKYDFMVVNSGLRNLCRDCDYFKLNDEEKIKEFFECTTIKYNHTVDPIITISKKHNIPLFYIGYVLPQFPTMGRLIKKHSLTNFSFFVQKLNEHIENYLIDNGCHYIDAESSAATHGKKTMLDDVWFIETHNTSHAIHDWDLGRHDNDRLDPYIYSAGRLTPLSMLHYESMVVEIISSYRSLNRIDEIKLVIFDLDGTFWRGNPAEGDIRTYAGWPAGVQEASLILKRRGIILAICSKNDYSFIETNWDNLLENRVPFNTFAIKKINFMDKIENIKSILQIANILPQNVLFVDDNPRERMSVQNAFPSIRVMGEDVLLWKKVLLTSSELQPITITNESMNKTETIQGIVLREEMRNKITHEEFLESINLKLNIEKTKMINANRTLELFNKTTQYNSISKSYSLEEMKEMIDNNNVWHGSVTDTYVNYGIVIACIVTNNVIQHIVMSCRVFNLNIEDSFFHFISTNNINISVSFKLSGKNSPCLNSLTRIGFDMTNVSETDITTHVIKNENNAISPSNHVSMQFSCN